MFGLDAHPAVVHFPVALGTVGAVMETFYFLVRRASVKWFGPVLLSLALVGSGAAYFTGQASEDKAEAQGIPEAPVAKHEETCLWALGALGLATLLSWAVRPRGGAIWLSTLVGLTAAGLTLYTGYLGGELVYRHGAGRVSASPQAPHPPPAPAEE